MMITVVMSRPTANALKNVSALMFSVLLRVGLCVLVRLVVLRILCMR